MACEVIPSAEKFGLTCEQARIMLHRQHGQCAICRKRFRPGRPAVVDHHHETGLVRGLLCSACNYTLGQLHEDRGWLRRAASYLVAPPAPLHLEQRVYTPGSPGAAGLVNEEDL